MISKAFNILLWLLLLILLPPMAMAYISWLSREIEKITF